MATMKTPGVYVEEITKFPPSVAPVATAIPAFIGYTEKAMEQIEDDLRFIPKRITSMLDYETYFGLAQNESDIDVNVDAEGMISISNTSPSSYKMYYSLQMYFANGGGPCYIVSCGDYDDIITLEDTSVSSNIIGLNFGLEAIRKQDEPTLLVFPDATGLDDDADYYSLQQSALEQCADLQDRFAIFDTYGDSETAIGSFRTGIGVNNLKYGAAYYPYLDTILDYRYQEEQVSVEISTGANTAQVVTDIVATLNPADFETVLNALITARDAAVAFGPATLDEATLTQVRNSTQAVIDYIADFESKFTSIIEIATEAGPVGTEDDLRDFLTANVTGVVSTLNGIQNTLNTTSSKNTVVNNLQVNGTNFFETIGGIAAVSSPLAPGDFTLYDDYAQLFQFGDTLDTIIIDINASSSITSLEVLETTNNDLYNRIKAAISAYPVTLPPSSAMAGIYARVDNAVGVWKAPANETVAYVVNPTVNVTKEDQEDMNVHSTGKSVNAIRTFVGKGTLVWGARTLAGNDNEWRYISVRRFFSFVEESVSEATEQFVFEPNTANTWVRVRGLIENFLLQQWKAGALAGSRPEDAYYVRIGLGQTMTAQDVLEGRMIVEIGMAAVRPAEFIVLRFSHKMQEA